MGSTSIRKKDAPGEKEKRDMLIYLLRKTGKLSNKEIGSLMGVTYSTVSKIISTFGSRIKTEKDVKETFEFLNSKIKV